MLLDRGREGTGDGRVTPIGQTARVAISCVYCGASHDNAADVRACWQRTEGVEAAPAASVPTPEPEPDHAGSDHAGSEHAGSVAADVGAGPSELGRNALVHTGAPTPAGWASVERITITTRDLDDATTLVAELRERAAARTPTLFVVEPGLIERLAEPESIDLALHRLGPRFELTNAALHHLLTANSIDVTRGDGAPRWRTLDLAIAAGASIARDGQGDVVLPNGTRAWLDGGPVRFTGPIDGVSVLHRVAVEHRSLQPFGTNDTAADLAPDQLAAVTHDGGAARIIAPAGSGKTRVLTERARHLLRQWALPAGAVSLVAFNQRAQEEMRGRTSDLRALQVRTLNAIALAIVNGTPPFAPRPRALQTIDEIEVRRIIGRLVTFPRKRNADPVATWIEALSMARLGLVDPMKVEQLYDGEVDGFTDVLPRYRAQLARAGQVDFDEQVQLAIEILLTDPGARAAAQWSCRVMLVDEFQDLTPAHLLLVRLLAGPDAAVFGVGDDDQTIYGYNGADPAWLIDFDQLFPGAGEHPLEVNYRCPPDVVAAADMLLRHNARRVAKTIRASKEAAGLTIEEPGAPVDTTVRIISEAVAAGRPTADIAVLTRVNSLLVPVQVGLKAAGVATSGGVGREFLDRVAVRAALAWLRLATSDGPLHPGDVEEALRRPARSMHPNVAKWAAEQTSLDGLRRLAARVNTEKDSIRIDEFAADIQRLQQLASSRGTTGAILAALRDSMGLATTIAQLDTSRHGMNRTSQSDDLTAIAQLAELQPDPKQFERWLRDAVSSPWSAGGVTLATVHKVKGQEWPLVVVHQADADQFPHRLADSTEEERRVFHVAITRASERLHIVPDEHPSPFIDDLTTPPSERRRITSATTRPTPPPAAAARPGHDLAGDDATLFAALKELRLHLAAGKPAYTVFPDATLAEIVRARPASLTALARISGVGPTKLERYGQSVLDVVERAAPSS